MTMLATTGILDTLITGLSLAFTYWWIWLPVILGFAAYQEWFGYQRTKYLAGLKWVLLEIVPPPDVLRSPRIAENIFSGLHAVYGGGVSWKSQFFTGKVPDWFSLEIVSSGGETHFYIRCPENQRNVIESLIFAQYPEAEIRQVDDYTTQFSEPLSLDQYDVAGTEFEFTKEHPYPIKTWPEFEEQGGKDENARIDPLAPLLEVMSALRAGEHLWLQMILRPTGGDWVKEGQKVIDKLIGKKEKPKGTPLVGKILTLPFVLLEMILTELGIAGPSEEKKKEEKKEEEFNLQKLTPAQKVVLEQVEYKMAKLAFKTGIRYVYVASKDAFNGSRPASVTAMFKQLYFNNLNSFKPAGSTRDKGILPWVFPGDRGFMADERTAGKKKGMFKAYRARAFPGKYMILNTEELATLWHLPGLNVRAPLLPRVQAKKGQPPAILPTK